MVDRGANIDLLFRNGLKDYEVLPPQEIWEGIQPTLKKHRTYSFIRIAASIAVMIALGGSSALLIHKTGSDLSTSSLQATRAESNVAADITGSGPVLNDMIRSDNQIPVQIAVNDPIDKTFISPASKFSLPEPGLYKSFIESDKSVKKKKDGSVIRIDPISTTVYPAGDNNFQGSGEDLKEESKPARESSRWSLGALVIPTYYSSFGFSNNEAEKNLMKTEEASVSYSSGLSFAYKIGRRISLQTGIYYSSIGQKVTGVDTYSGFSRFNDSKGSSPFSIVTSSGTIASTNRDVFLSDNITGNRVITSISFEAFDPVKADLSYISNTLHQNFDYLEFPILMKYKVLDRVVDFNLTGGISYNILINNSSYAESGGEKYYIGNTGSLNPVTFSSSFGMGIEYNFSRKLSLNLEPTFRYFLTTPGGQTSPTIHPYSFGVLSGISYKF